MALIRENPDALNLLIIAGKMKDAKEIWKGE